MKIFFDQETLLKYSKDWLGRSLNQAICVARPKTEDDVILCLQLAQKENYKIKIIGGNTSLSGQTIITKERTLVIDTSFLKMNLTLNENILLISSGYTLFEANEYLREFNRFIPLHMGSHHTATLGGIVSTNSGGMHAWKYGMARNLVRGIRCVLPNQNIIEENTTTLKNNTSMGISDIVIGAEGKFGIITELSIATYPINNISDGVLIRTEKFEELNQVFNVFENYFLNHIEVCEFFVKPYFLDDEENLSTYNILIGLSDIQDIEKLFESFEEGLKDIRGNASEYMNSIFLLNYNEYNKILSFRENIPVKHAEYEKIEKFDLTIPKNKVNNLYNYLKNKLDIKKFTFFGHFLDGNIHLNISSDNCNSNLVSRIYEFVISNSGSYSAEHGIGLFKKDLYQKYKNKESQNLFKAIKLQIDKDDILY